MRDGFLWESRSTIPHYVTIGALVVAAIVIVVAVMPFAWQTDDVPRWRLDEITDAKRPGGVTQGFEIHDGLFVHSVGGYGSSAIRMEGPDGSILAEERLPADEYAEGATVAGNVLWHITWREGVAYRRDIEDLAVLARVAYEGEGWGLCFDATTDRLVMSNGSAALTLRDRVTFDVERTIDVTMNGRPVRGINELECVDGIVWANVFGRDQLLRITPSGVVDAVVNVPTWSDAGDVNGIAHAGGDRFWLTGKNWPTRHLVRITPP